jgi:DNA-directed RNA polymerase subunit F
MDQAKVAQLVQVLAVVCGVVLSVMSFNSTREKDAAARVVEAETRRIEALAPFYELRQKRYVEISEVAAILSDRKYYTEEEITNATRRFRALYISELSMVESGDVESTMKELARSVSQDLLKFTEPQRAAYKLSHALKESFTYEK